MNRLMSDATYTEDWRLRNLRKRPRRRWLRRGLLSVTVWNKSGLAEACQCFDSREHAASELLESAKCPQTSSTSSRGRCTCLSGIFCYRISNKSNMALIQRLRRLTKNLDMLAATNLSFFRTMSCRCWQAAGDNKPKQTFSQRSRKAPKTPLCHSTYRFLLSSCSIDLTSVQKSCPFLDDGLKSVQVLNNSTPVSSCVICLVLAGALLILKLTETPRAFTYESTESDNEAVVRYRKDQGR